MSSYAEISSICVKISHGQEERMGESRALRNLEKKVEALEKDKRNR
jgi:hypothetical protein